MIDLLELKNLLKLLDLVNSGGEARHMIRSGKVKVDNEVEIRPGKKLRAGNTINYDNQMIVINP